MSKLIITTGCSYTGAVGSGPPDAKTERVDVLPPDDHKKYYRGWPDHLSECLGIKVLNLGSPAAGNEYIMRATRWGVHHALQTNYNPEDITVFIQITSPERKDILVEIADQIDPDGYGCGCWIKHNDPATLTHTIDEVGTLWYEHHVAHNPSNFIPSQTANQWVKRTHHRRDLKIWGPNNVLGEYYQKLYNEEYHCLLMMETIIGLQDFLKSWNIKFKIFYGWDVMSEFEEFFKSHLSQYTEVQKRMTGWANTFVNKLKANSDASASLNSFWNKEINFENVNYMIDLVDDNTMWWHKRHNNNHLGMREWVIDNLPRKDWNYSNKDSHPSNNAHKEFARQIIAPLYGELNNEN